MREWIKSPLAILAQGAEGGVVVDHGVIVELVPSGGRPSAPVETTFDASRHVVLPGLVKRRCAEAELYSAAETYPYYYDY